MFGFIFSTFSPQALLEESWHPSTSPLGLKLGKSRESLWLSGLGHVLTSWTNLQFSRWGSTWLTLQRCVLTLKSVTVANQAGWAEELPSGSHACEMESSWGRKNEAPKKGRKHRRSHGGALSQPTSPVPVSCPRSDVKASQGSCPQQHNILRICGTTSSMTSW